MGSRLRCPSHRAAISHTATWVSEGSSRRTHTTRSPPPCCVCAYVTQPRHQVIGGVLVLAMVLALRSANSPESAATTPVTPHLGHHHRPKAHIIHSSSETAKISDAEGPAEGPVRRRWHSALHPLRLARVLICPLGAPPTNFVPVFRFQSKIPPLYRRH